MQPDTTTPFDEIAVGASATLVRRVATAPSQGDPRAAGAEALLFDLLQQHLPGAGGRILEQSLRYQGSVGAGDELEATVTVRAKRAEDRSLVLDCRVGRGSDTLVTGTATVRPAAARAAQPVEAEPILRPGGGFDALLRRCEALPPVRCAVAWPCDADSLMGAIEAARRSLIVPVLIGPEARIREVANALGTSLAGAELVAAADPREAAQRAVAMARDGEAEALMKGSLHTDELMGAVVPSATGIRTARRVSHVFVHDVPSYPRLLMITDAAVNIAPSLREKVDIVQNAIELAHVLGVATPRVAVLSAVETVNPDIPSTLDAAALCKMADRGQITGGLLDGPLAFDNAVSEDAARIKGIVSEVAGRADVLVVPNLESGNMIAKELVYLAGADCAGVVLGTRVPIVLTSRADNVRTRLASTIVMALVANARRGPSR